MKIIKELPPNIDLIDQKFKVKSNKNILYTYGDSIYTLCEDKIPVWLIEHETVHSQRQKEIGSPDHWWECYIEQPLFRLSEELLAHSIEYSVFRALHNRNESRLYLSQISKRLSSEIYGNIITAVKAKSYIKKLCNDRKLNHSEIIHP
jgi:hypothetical protein